MFELTKKNLQQSESERIFHNYKPIKNANERARKIAEDNAKRILKESNPKIEYDIQRMGRLYNTSSDSDLIHYEFKSYQQQKKKKKNMESNFSLLSNNDNMISSKCVYHDSDILHTVSTQHSMKSKYQISSSSNKQKLFNTHSGVNWEAQYLSGHENDKICPMRSDTAIHLLEKTPGGKYHVPDTLDPYDVAFQGKPQDSVYTTTTPSEWNISKKRADHEASAHTLMESAPPSTKVCSKSALLLHWNATGMDASTEGTGETGSVSSSSKDPAILYPSAPQSRVDAGLANSTKYSNWGSCPSVLESRIPSGTNEKDLSALQRTLLSCGKLQLAADKSSKSMEKNIAKALESDVKMTKKHARWLQRRKKGSYTQRPDFARTGGPSISTLPSFAESGSYGRFLEDAFGEGGLQRRRPQTREEVIQLTRTKGMPNKSTQGVRGSALEENSSYVAGDTRDFTSQSITNAKKSNSTFEKSVKSIDKQNKVSTYDEDLAKHLEVTTSSESGNPYRSQYRNVSRVPLSCAQSVKMLKERKVDSKMYSDSVMHTNYGGYNVTVKEPNVSSVPSKDNITRAVVQISRRVLVSYDTKIVETGATLRALQDLRHPTPGIAAIVDLNRAFIDAAAFNPSPWQLSRLQFQQVLQEKVPWLELDVIKRLASAYDPHRSGVIKYVRITAALIAGNRPAMSVLMAQLSRDPDNVDKTGNVFVLRLLHGLYEDCDGGIAEQAASTLDRVQPSSTSLTAEKTEGAGIKLEDIVEILSACSCSVEDELRMREVAEEVVQVLFEDGQKHDFVSETTTVVPKKTGRMTSHSRSTKRETLLFGNASTSTSECTASSKGEDEYAQHRYNLPHLGGDRPLASVVLKHQTLKGVRAIPRVSQNEFVKCVTRHPTLMTEFNAQLTRFRELMHPYAIKGSISYEDSVLQNSAYGSRSKRYTESS